MGKWSLLAMKIMYKVEKIFLLFLLFYYLLILVTKKMCIFSSDP